MKYPLAFAQFVKNQDGVGKETHDGDKLKNKKQPKFIGDELVKNEKVVSNFLITDRVDRQKGVVNSQH